MIMTSVALPASVHSYLRHFVRRRRLFAFLRAIAVAICASGGVLLASCLVDRVLQLPGYSRLALSLGIVALFAVIIAKPAGRLLQQEIDWLDAAADLERCSPAFTQRLQTVVSQMIEDPRYRGSPAILEHLLSEITEQAVRDRPGQWLQWRTIVPAWSMVGAVALAFFVLAMIPAVGLPTLTLRFARPLAGIAPVTTTRITASPGDIRLLRGKELLVRARVKRLGSGSMDIFTSQDGKSWSKFQMQAVSEDQYSFSLPSVDRDLSYYIRGGDATTPTYSVTVLRPPTVAEYRVRYEYREYTKRGVHSDSNTDGTVEALVGTRVTLSLVSAEPLKSARLSNGLDLELHRTTDPLVYETQFLIEDNRQRELDLEMTSPAGLSATVKKAVTIRGLADRKPLVRLLVPSESLRLHPRDLLPIQYQATDDYGISSLTLNIQINGVRDLPVPLPIQSDPCRQEGQFYLELASLDVHVGDVVRLELLARDEAKNEVRSDSDRERERRLILISPRSVDVGTRLRVTELRQAWHQANVAREELEHAGESLERSKQQSTPEAERAGERLKVGRAIARAADASLSAHQSILRACARSGSPQQTRCLADLADQCRMLLCMAERLGADSGSVADPTFGERLRSAVGSSRQLASHLSTLSEGEEAAMILIERQNLRAPPATQPVDRAGSARNAAIQSAQQELAAMIRELGLPVGSPDLDNQLQRKADAARGLIGASRQLDFEAPAAEWSAAIRRGDPRPPLLEERLTSASAVEAMRPDSDPVRARDLQLVARAAERLGPMASQEEKTAQDAARDALVELPRTIATLQREHRLNRRPGEVSAEEVDQIRKSAATARAMLAEWAAQSDSAIAFEQQLDVEPEDLALQANVETWRRSYAGAVALDQRLSRRIRAQALEDSALLLNIKLAMDSVRTIDQLISQQEDLRRQANAPAAGATAQIAAEQHRLAAEIARVRTPDRHILQPLSKGGDSRQLGIAALQQAHQQLAQLPEQLKSASAALRAQRQAAGKAAEAQRALGAARPENKAAATVAWEQSQRELKKATETLAALTAAVSTQAIDRMARQLRLYEPESHDAVEMLVTQLQPALATFHQALKAGDGGAADRAVQPAGDAAARVQRLLNEAQLRLVDRDALAAAKWLATAAAAALAGASPDLQQARSYQDSAIVALNRAWHDAAREAALARLAATPAFRVILNAQPVETGRPGRSIADVLPAIRQWAPLRQRQTSELSMPTREADAPGYLESLRLYFEGIYRAQEAGRKN